MAGHWISAWIRKFWWHRVEEAIPPIEKLPPDPVIWHSERAEERQRELRRVEREQQELDSRLAVLDIEMKARTGRGLH